MVERTIRICKTCTFSDDEPKRGCIRGMFEVLYVGNVHRYFMSVTSHVVALPSIVSIIYFVCVCRYVDMYFDLLLHPCMPTYSDIRLLRLRRIAPAHIWGCLCVREC